MTEVFLAQNSRDGWILRWKTQEGFKRQQRTKGRNHRQREAERKQKEEELNRTVIGMTWESFWEQIDEMHLAEMSEGHAAKCKTMQTRLVAAASKLGLRPLLCGDIGPIILAEVEKGLIRSGNAPATRKSNMDTLWSMLTWGMERGLIPDIPRPKKPRGKSAKRAKQAARKSKGRSLTPAEIAALTAAIPNACRKDEKREGFLRAIKAAELIGMRKAELWLFSWEPLPGAHYPIRLHTDSPAIQFSDEQKNGLEEEVPLTPEAAAWLRSLPRDGGLWICRTHGLRGQHSTSNRLGRVVAKAGKAAGIVVKRNQDGSPMKFASLHDLRRTFATTLHQKLNVSELQKMTRHADAATLMDYYDDAPTAVLMQKLNGFARES